MKNKNNHNSENDIYTDTSHHLKINLHSASVNINNHLASISDINGTLLNSNIVDPDSLKILQIDPTGIANSTILSKNTIFNLKDETNTPWDPSVVAGLNISQGIIEVESSNMLQKCGDNFIIDSSNKLYEDVNLVNGVIPLYDPTLINPNLVAEDVYKDNTLFIKDGFIVENPTNLLVSGSISNLSLFENNNINFDTSIIENSVDNDFLLNITHETKNILADSDWGKIGSEYNFDLLEQTKIKDSFLDLSANYFELYSGAPEHNALSLLPDNLIDLTPKEYFNEAALFRSTSAATKTKDKDILSKKLSTNEILLRHLSNLNPDLKNLYIGALEALNSNNVDRVRHYSSSLRDLFTHALHLLSPDEKLKVWSKDPAHFHNKRPTRSARMLYIARKINDDKFKKFINSDIKSTLEFIDLFHCGTHKIKSSYSEVQLSIMRTKMEETLIFLIECSIVN